MSLLTKDFKTTEINKGVNYIPLNKDKSNNIMVQNHEDIIDQY